jgi:hypothetical protein
LDLATITGTPRTLDDNITLPASLTEITGTSSDAFNAGGKTLTLGGNVTFNGVEVSNGTIAAGGKTLTVGANGAKLADTFTVGSGTVAVSGGTLTLDGAAAFNGVTVTTGSSSSAVAIKTGKTLTLNNGSTLTVNGTGSVTVESTAGLEIKDGTTVTIGEGSVGAISLANDAAITVGGTLTLGSNVTINPLAGSMIVESTGTLDIDTPLTDFTSLLSTASSITLNQGATFEIQHGGGMKTITGGSSPIFNLDAGTTLKLGVTTSSPAGVKYIINGTVTLTQNLGSGQGGYSSVSFYPIQGSFLGGATGPVDELELKDNAELVVGNSVTLAIDGDLTPGNGAKITVATGNTGQTVAALGNQNIGGVFIPDPTGTNKNGLGTALTGYFTSLAALTAGTKTWNGSAWN